MNNQKKNKIFILLVDQIDLNTPYGLKVEIIYLYLDSNKRQYNIKISNCIRLDSLLYLSNL